MKKLILKSNHLLLRSYFFNSKIKTSIRLVNKTKNDLLSFLYIIASFMFGVNLIYPVIFEVLYYDRFRFNPTIEKSVIFIFFFIALASTKNIYRALSDFLDVLVFTMLFAPILIAINLVTNTQHDPHNVYIIAVNCGLCFIVACSIAMLKNIIRLIYNDFKEYSNGYRES